MTTTNNEWPALDYGSWSDTLDTLHQWIQIIGKIRLKTMPWQNHSWHTTLYVSPTGFTTGTIPYEGGAFEIEFDFIRHHLMVRSTFGADQKLDLQPMTVADFYLALMDMLKSIGLNVKIHGRPNELAHNTPFAENTFNKSYDKEAVRNFWMAMVKVNCVFTRFRSEFIGKCSPIHLFWGAFDLAVTRFSGKRAPLHPGGMPNMPLQVMQEAYSHEVSSAGFWPGSKDSPQPMFYSYCYPTPDAFGKTHVEPKEAFWSEEMGEFFLTYASVQRSNDPDATLMAFLRSTYVAAADTGGWPRVELENR